MSIQQFRIDHIYNPDNQTKEQLIDGFVVRLKIFKRLFEDIREASMKAPEQHYLIEGKRGMGKTSLLLRLGYAIENDEGLHEWLLPIVFNEEEYSIRRLFKLWLKIASLLEEKDSQFLGLQEEMDNCFEQYATYEAYEYAIFQLLTDRLESSGKKLILFIDNFGDIFSKFNRQEVQRLRTVLQTTTHFRLFSASSRVLEAFYDSKHPFFELFKVVRLRGLDQTETHELLLKLGESYQQEQIQHIIQTQSGRIEALRRLTGGVIRTIVLLFEIFIDHKQGSAFSDLESILDRVTPLYKHRMDDLPAQQQDIVEAIAFAWDAVNVQEISKKTHIISKTVSAQLRQMEKNEIVSKILTHNKNHLYQLSERFFNIWFLMRHGRKGDNRKVLWLVRFLEEWCDERELVDRAKRHIDLMKNGEYDTKGAYYLSEALAGAKNLPTSIQDELLKASRDFQSKKKSGYELHVSSSDMELHEEAFEYYKKGDYRGAIDFFKEIREEDYFMIANCYRNLAAFSEAEKYYQKAVDHGNVDALINLGILNLEVFNNSSKAQELFLKAEEKGNLESLYYLGWLYKNILFDLEKAKNYYNKAANNGNSSAFNDLGILYNNELNNISMAEECYLKAAEMGNASSFFNLGLLYDHDLNDSNKAEEYYLKAAENGVEKAYFNLGFLYKLKRNNIQKAIDYFLAAAALDDVFALNELGVIYEVEFNDFDKAETYYKKAVENNLSNGYNNLAHLYFRHQVQKNRALELISEASKLENHLIIDHTYASILLWHGRIEQSTSIASKFLFNEEFFTGYPDATHDYLLLLLAKEQYSFLYHYFNSPKAKELHLKDRFKPIWYALMYHMQEEYPTEYLRMGEELEETVKEIIAKVEQMRVDYA